MNNYYTVCPNCGYKLLRARGVEALEMQCPKCKGKLLIEIHNGKVVTQCVARKENERPYQGEKMPKN